MANINGTAADHLKVLAGEFTAFFDLSARVIEPIGKPSHLRVLATDLPDLAEEITCVPDEARPGHVTFLWSWGDRVPGDRLADKAAAIAHVLRADTHHG